MYIPKPYEKLVMLRFGESTFFFFYIYQAKMQCVCSSTTSQKILSKNSKWLLVKFTLIKSSMGACLSLLFYNSFLIAFKATECEMLEFSPTTCTELKVRYFAKKSSKSHIQDSTLYIINQRWKSKNSDTFLVGGPQVDLTSLPGS